MTNPSEDLVVGELYKCISSFNVRTGTLPDDERFHEAYSFSVTWMEVDSILLPIKQSKVYYGESKSFDFLYKGQRYHFWVSSDKTQDNYWRRFLVKLEV